MRITIFVLFFTALLCAEDTYVCKNDGVYQNYVAGNVETLDNAVHYIDKGVCESNCRTYESCVLKDISDTHFLIDGKDSLTLNDAAEIEGQIHGRTLSQITIDSEGRTFLFEFPETIQGDVFNFPDGEPSSYDQSVLTSVAYSSGEDYIALTKTFQKIENDVVCDNGDEQIDNMCYKTLGSSFDINATQPCLAPNLENNETCIERVAYEAYCPSGGFRNAKKCTKYDSNSAVYGVSVSQDGISSKMFVGTYIDPGTEEIIQSKFYMNASSVGEGYTCDFLKGQIQEGDIKDNLFSSQNECESYCFAQNSCATVSENSENCIATDASYSNPVTDWTGKTVYTQSSQTVVCTSKSIEQTGCDKYKIHNNMGSINYDLSKIGWKYSTYEGMEDAEANALMMEQLQHIFAGWKGYCESGKVWNNPFSNPLTILSYCMMAYSVGMDGGFGEGIQEGLENVTDSFTEIGDSVTSAFTGAPGVDPSYIDGWSAGALIKGGETSTGLMSKIASINFSEPLWQGTVGGVQLTLKWSAIASAAYSLAFPPEEEVIAANELLTTYMGGSASSNAALNYVSCMASIGLSFPNMASWAANDIDGMSYQLTYPFENPIRLTDRQVAILIKATAPNFVQATLKPIEVVGDNMMTYIALTPLAYQQVGQVLCSDKLAISQNIINQGTTTQPDSGGGEPDYGMIAAKLAISMLPPPANLICSVILDVLTSFEGGDACHDQEIAAKWGMIQFKTNQHLNFDQCHKTGSSCVAKYFWGSCMRTRHNYCCYDQIGTRIIVEGLKVQLGKDWKNCSDVSINELKDISFTPCSAGQDPQADKCFPADKYEEFIDMLKTQASKGMDTLNMNDLVNQGINAMAIPGRDLKEICKDCEN